MDARLAQVAVLRNLVCAPMDGISMIQNDLAGPCEAFPLPDLPHSPPVFSVRRTRIICGLEVCGTTIWDYWDRYFRNLSRPIRKFLFETSRCGVPNMVH
jgi:hypothetical protein